MKLYQIVLADIQRMSGYVKQYESAFIEEYLSRSAQEEKKVQAKRKSDLDKASCRITKLDTLIENPYEYSVTGKTTEERFQTLTARYEEEQSGIKLKMVALREEYDGSRRKRRASRNLFGASASTLR